MDNLRTCPSVDDDRSTAATAESARPASSVTRSTCSARDTDANSAAGDRPRKVAYLASRFPKITETFILYEMRAVESLGVEVELYPLRREPTKVMHEEARAYVERAHFERLLSRRTITANLAALLRRPRIYCRTLATGIRANWGSTRYLLGFLASFPKAVVFAQDIQQRGVQHVHAHFASHPAAVAWVIGRLTGVPYSFTAHGSDLHRDQHMLKEKVAEAALVVAISDYNRRLILEHCGAEHEDHVRVIHCGTDTSAFRPRRAVPSEAPAAQPESAEELRIACVGTLHEVKGQVHLIRACALLRESGLPFRLHLFGDGPDEAKLRAEAARGGIASAVVFHGRCTRSQLARLLPEMDVVVAPSVPTSDGRREGIPVALMEAMSAGVAVVASSLSGIPELVRHRVSGLLVPPGDVPAIADALRLLAEAPQWRLQLAAAARETVERDFDQTRCAERLIEAIRLRHQKVSISSPSAQWQTDLTHARLEVQQ